MQEMKRLSTYLSNCGHIQSLGRDAGQLFYWWPIPCYACKQDIGWSHCEKERRLAKEWEAQRK